MKKICFLLAFVFVLGIYANAFAEEPDVKAAGAVLIDKESKRVLWGRNIDEPMAMASTTKIMTAIVALENSSLDKVVTIEKEATLAPKVKMNLSVGEQITMEQLLYALMLQSSNDAAIAIAMSVAGSVDEFCKMMTDKAAELGCTDTVFETPNGLDKGNHHSTPYDMALITAYALNNPDFVRIIGTKSISFRTNKSTYVITNKDRFLFEYDGAIGVKTGFTGKAGHCFVGAAKRNNITIISVVLASGWGAQGKNNKWTDTRALMDYGFENFTYKQLVNKGAIVKTVALEKGDSKELNLILDDDYGTLVKNDDKFKISLDLPKSLQLPVKKGQKIGTANVFVNDVLLAEIPICADKSVRKLTFCDYFFTVLKKWTEIAF